MLTLALEWSLRNRAIVLAGWGAVIAIGILSALRLPVDAFPDSTPVQVTVNTVASALSPLEIERRITRPIEWSLGGFPRLAEMRSVSKFGFSQVTLTFEDGTDVYFARQVVSERLQAGDWPAEVEGPRLGPVATGLGEVFHYLVEGEGLTLAELRTVQDWIIEPQLRAVPGVAEVNSWGGDERQVHVLVDPLRLQQFGLSLTELKDALLANNASVGAGTLERAGEASLIQGRGLVTALADVREIVVAAHEGVPVLVADVARVVEGREIRRGAVTAGGRGEVVLGLGFMLMGENTREVTERLKARLEELRASLPPGVRVTTVYDRTTLVDRVLATVETNLLEGALLVVAVLFVFLGNLRAGLIVAAAIPLSMLFAANMMLRFGIAGSLMSLGAIDFGLIVDSSVIQVENVMRRLAQDQDRERLDVIRDAVIEVRKPTLLGELIIAVVYLPILTLQGIEGKLFRPMALTVIFALAGSMLLSLTLVPVLASFALRRERVHRENVLVRVLTRRYLPVLRFALARPATVLGIALLALAGAGLLATRLGSEFVPRLREGSIVINTVRLASVALDESVRYGLQIERALLEKFPDEIEHVWTRTGSAEVATDPMGIELSDVFVALTPKASWSRASSQEALVRAMADELSVFPGMRAIFTQPIEMRVNEMIAGVRADVAVKLFGDDFTTLANKALQVEALLRGIPGAADVIVEQVTGQPVIEITADRAAMARYGISVEEVLGTVEALGTRPVGTMQDGEVQVPIALRLEDRYRRGTGELERMLVAAPNGDRIPLDRLTRVETVEGPSTIHREWGRRRIVIQANVRDRDVGGFVRDVKRALEERFELPPGYYLRLGGQFEHFERARTRLLLVVPLALISILTLLYFTYGRLVDALRVFTGVPFAAIGGIVALWLRDMPFSISAAVGFVALSGVSVLADMVLVSTIRHELASGRPLVEAIEIAATTRLRPVLMTALVASLGFVPMAINTGFGAEVQRPLATVVIGGVISSTALTLVVLPVLYKLTARAGRAG